MRSVPPASAVDLTRNSRIVFWNHPLTQVVLTSFMRRQSQTEMPLIPGGASRLRLDRGDGDGVDDIFRFATSRQIVGRSIQAL
jgi:hypothetical protein